MHFEKISPRLAIYKSTNLAMSHNMINSPKSKKEASHSHHHSNSHHQGGNKVSCANANNNCHSSTSKRGSARTSSLSSASSTSAPMLSFNSANSASTRALKSQAEGHFKKMMLMAEGNEEQLVAVVAFLESTTKLMDSSQPKLHACLLCSYRSDSQAVADAHLADHQKGRRFCCAFSSCAFAADDRGAVVEHVKRKHFTDEYDTRVSLANNYVHEMGRANGGGGGGGAHLG